MIKDLIKSFKCAFFGIGFCIRNERNLRIHLVAFFYIMIFAFLFEMPQVKHIILLVALTAVIVSEMLNTSVEELVNIVKPGYDQLARVAKDVAAGAVLACSISAGIVTVSLFWDIEKWLKIFKLFGKNPILLVLLIASLILSLIFIFVGPRQTRAVLYSLRNNKNAGKK